MNNNSAVIINHMASLYGMNDVTHLGFFDIPMLTSIPNLVYLAPTNNEELLAMTEYAVHQQDHPVAIRVPVGEFTSTGVVEGGWGQRVASFYGLSNVRVKNYGIAKEFHDRYDATELLKENGVSLEQIVADAK